MPRSMPARPAHAGQALARARPALAGLVILALGALGATGCGKAPTVRLAGRELRLRLDEYRIKPSSVSVPAGKLKIVAFNGGVLTHNVALEYADRTASGAAAIIDTIPTIQPGTESQAIKVTLAPGRYTLESTIANQADLGMVATLIVRAR